MSFENRNINQSHPLQSFINIATASAHSTKLCAIRENLKVQRMAYLECLLFVVGLTICSGRVTGPPQNDRSGKHGTIAFSVGLTSTLHMSYSETIIYDKVFSNFGDGYSVDTGEFTAPDTGVYVFHAHAYNSNQDRAMWIELIKNIDSLVSVSGYNSHSTAGNTVIVSLHKGETVAVRARPGQEFTLFGKSDQVYTTFSGYRIGEIPYSDPAAGFGR